MKKFKEGMNKYSFNIFAKSWVQNYLTCLFFLNDKNSEVNRGYFICS